MEEEPKLSSPIRNVKFSNNGSRLAVLRKSGQVEMWSVSTWECQWSTTINPGYNYLAFSADDSKIACNKDDEIIVLDAESGEECNREDTFMCISAYVS